MKVKFVDSTFCKLHLDNYIQLMNFRVNTVEYVPRKKKYVDKLVNLYVAQDDKVITIYRGLLFYVVYIFRDEITNIHEVRDNLKSTLDIPVDTFTELRDYQMSDLKSLLKFNIGLFQVMTGYGKTEVIARLLKYLNDMNIKTLVVTSSNKSRGELVHRCGKYNVDIPGYYDTKYTVNIINSKGFFNSDISKDQDTLDHLKSVEVVLFDEVEKSLNQSIRDALESIFINRKCLYGFSATTNKVNSDRIHPENEESYLHQRNRDLVSYFGYATCYKLPKDVKVNIRQYRFSDKFDFPVDADYNSHLLIKEMYTTPEFTRNLRHVIEESKKTIYIPINSRVAHDYWLDRLRTEYVILYISGSGYTVYHPIVGEQNLDLDTVKGLMDSEMIDIILSTISGYNSLDLSNINTIIVLMNENTPDNCLQAVGRCREKELNIAFLTYDYFIPIYTKKREHQFNQILNHYKNTKDLNVEEIRL